MFTDRDIYVARCRRQDLRAEAERERLHNLVADSRGLWIKYYRWSLARLGAWLVAWGNRLQERHTAPTIPALAVQRK